MKRTRVTTLIITGVVGIVLGSLVQVALASIGRPGITPPITLAVGLAIIGLTVIAMAIPIRRATKSTARSRVDPFYATRVVVLAKASAICGALVTGIAGGFIIYLLTRSVPGVGSIGFSIAATAGAVVLLVGGLVAEQMCRIPPDDGDDKPDKKPVEAVP